MVRPVAWLVSTREAAAAPLFVLLIVAWTTFTGRRVEAFAAGALALATLAPAWREPERWLPLTSASCSPAWALTHCAYSIDCRILATPLAESPSSRKPPEDAVVI